MQAKAPSKRSSKQTALPPRNRGRPPVIANESLLEVARQVFLEHGIRATTAEVARRAGISEGTVFHRFGSKDALFRAAMRFDPTEVPPFLSALPGRAGQGDLRETLIEVGAQLLELGRVALPVMMMSWSNPDETFSPEKMALRSAGFRRMIEPVVRFFDQEMRLGRLTMGSPELLARIFFGALHHYCMSELCLLGEGTFRLTPSQYVHGLIDVLLATVDPEARTEPRKRPKLARL